MMNRSALLDLLTRYEAHQCSPEEIQLVEQWYELLGEPVELPLTEAQWQVMEQKLWRQVRPSVPEREVAPVVTPLWSKVAVWATGIAALLAVVVGLNWNRFTGTDAVESQPWITKVEQADWTRYQNKSSHRKSVRLSDGSVVVLAAHAQLAVHKHFNTNNRNVRLLGEASFRVHRDPARPFLVYSGDIITKVLGTTFQVRANDLGEPIQVTVQSGKVTVYRQASTEAANVLPSSGVILTPNQKAIYFPDNKQFVTGIAENPQPISTVTERVESAQLVFKETPISEVIQRLEVIYGMEIDLEQESLSQCPFTGNLTHQPLYTKLELLCGTINGSYEVRGTKILVTGNGCQ
jgi:transmembrane sensor